MAQAMHIGWPGEMANWAPRYGITLPHWATISEYAAAEHLYLLVRARKESALRWITERFPGKPMELGFLKVDEKLGLLLATDPEKARQVYASGHYVLAPQAPVTAGSLPHRPRDTGHAPALLVAVNPRLGQLPKQFREPWACAGLVIDRQTQKPFTSDYDLAAVIGAGNSFDYAGSLGSMSPGSSGTAVKGKHQFTTPYIEGHRSRLNALLGSKRILHGTQLQYYQAGAPGGGTGGGTLAHSGTETILAFHPDRSVYQLLAPAGIAGEVFAYEVLLKLHPDKASTVFNQ